MAKKSTTKKLPDKKLVASSKANDKSPDPAKPTRYQKFNIGRVHRRELKNAPCNPREMDRYAREKLKKNLRSRKIGLLGPPIWNEQSGNLVGGHQRLFIIDDLEGSDDYFVDVAVVSLDPKTEREQIIALNNADMQGYFKVELLDDLVRSEDGFDIESAGFDRVGLEALYDSAGMETKILDSLFSPEALKETHAAADEVDAAIAESDALKGAEKAAVQQAKGGADATAGNGKPEVDIALIKERRKQFNVKTAHENECDFFFTIVCKTDEQKHSFLRLLDLNETKAYVSSEELLIAMGLELSALDAKPETK